MSLFMGFFDKTPPQLSYGKPFDPSADVPLFPPAAMMLTMMTSRLIWKLTGKRLSWVPRPFSAMAFRIALLAVGLACTKLVVLDGAGAELSKAGSGTLFVPVEGLATDGLYMYTRNPMYASLVFFALPCLATVTNSAWPILLSPLPWAYLNYVVIAAEEKLLAATFGNRYAAYCETVPRWLI